MNKQEFLWKIYVWLSICFYFGSFAILFLDLHKQLGITLPGSNHEWNFKPY